MDVAEYVSTLASRASDAVSNALDGGGLAGQPDWVLAALRQRREVATKAGLPWLFVPADPGAFAVQASCTLCSTGKVVQDCAKKVPLAKGASQAERDVAVAAAAQALGIALHAVVALAFTGPDDPQVRGVLSAL